jgi:hypothetical protein
MSAHSCCEGNCHPSNSQTPNSASSEGKPPRVSFAQRCLRTIKWLLPGTILALIPKCPICFAAYVAVGTGIGLSVTAASYLRTGLIVLCVGSLLFLVVKKVRFKRN